MSFIVAAPPERQAFRRVPSGNHVARCIGLIDLGTQAASYAGEEKLQHKVRILFEVLGEDDNGVPLTVEMSDGTETPMTISKNYTVSMHEKASMRKDIQTWRGKPYTPEELAGFDIERLLGAYCMLNVVEVESSNGKTYSNITAIAPVPRGMPKPQSNTPFVLFSMSNPDMKVFDSFHDKLKETIQASVEWRERTAKLSSQPAKAAQQDSAATSFAEMDDDIPF